MQETTLSGRSEQAAIVHACLEPFDPPEGTQMSDNFNPSTDDFAAMFESSTAASAMQEGQVIPATVIRIDNDAVLVDIGLKTESRSKNSRWKTRSRKPATSLMST